jgi:hypothetical protein
LINFENQPQEKLKKKPKVGQMKFSIWEPGLCTFSYVHTYNENSPYANCNRSKSATWIKRVVICIWIRNERFSVFNGRCAALWILRRFFVFIYLFYSIKLLTNRETSKYWLYGCIQKSAYLLLMVLMFMNMDDDGDDDIKFAFLHINTDTQTRAQPQMHTN